MRPRIKPAVHRARRDAHTVQLGVDPRHCVLVEGLDPAEHALIDELDGTRDLDGVLALAVARGIAPERVVQLVRLIDDAGLIEDAASDRSTLAGLDLAERDRIAPDLALWSLAHRHRDGGAGLLARRRAAHVRVEGAGRVGAALVGLLHAAGVGGLDVRDESTTAASDLGPGGLVDGDLGLPRALALAQRLGTRASLASPGAVDVVVVCEPEPSALLRSRALVAARQTHLVVTTRETQGIVGPFVIPGLTCCAYCLELHRTSADAAWPSVLAQLLHREQPWCTVGVETVLASALAATAALVVLAQLDRPPTTRPGDSQELSVAPTLPVLPVNETWEIALPDARLRRRRWSPHPRCGCGAWDGQWSA